jgi:hypothetical protein
LILVETQACFFVKRFGSSLVGLNQHLYRIYSMAAKNHVSTIMWIKDSLLKLLSGYYGMKSLLTKTLKVILYLGSPSVPTPRPKAYFIIPLVPKKIFVVHTGKP